MSEAMIEARNVVKAFDGFRALDGLTMTVPRGSIYGLVGPNGAGKSTLLRHVTGIYRQDSGSVLLEGNPIYENPAAKARIASIPDELYYFLSASTRDMMRFYRGFYPRFDVKRYEALKAQSGPAEKSTLELSARSSRLGKKTIELRHVTKAFDGRTVLRDFDCMLLRDDRIGIVGANGSGKSTLLNLIAGDLIPDGGEIEVGETVRVGYFRQEVPDMDGDTRVIDYVKAIGNRIETPEGMLTASQLLEQFLFPAEEQWSPINKLSGGEKRRLYLLSVLAAAPNVLLLDEPTNDLDLQTLAALEDYLDSFPGAVVTVSHDRYFINQFATRIWMLEDGKITDFEGTFAEYRAWKEKKQPAPPPKKEEAPVKKEKPKRPGGTKNLEKEVAAAERAVAKAEERQYELTLKAEEVASNYLELQKVYDEQKALEEEIAHLYAVWERLSAELEEAKAE